MEEDKIPLDLQVFALALRTPGAITYFYENLPLEAVGLPSGNTGLHEIYTSLVDFHHKTGLDPIDPIAFKAWLENETELYAAFGGEPVVDSFIEQVFSIELSTADSITGILKFRANKRKQLDSVQELHLLLSKKEFKTEDDRLRVKTLTEQIRELENDIGYNPLATVFTGHDLAERAWDLWELPDFMPTQFKELNKAMGYQENGGFCKGAVHAILANSGKGKSTFAKCLANHWLDQGHAVLYVNFEEAKAHWERILLTQVTGRNVYEGNVDDATKVILTKKFQKRMEKWGERFMVKHDPDTPYFDDLEKWLRDIMGHNSCVPDVVIIDTIQSMFVKGAGHGGPRWGQFEEMMVRFEKLAKDMNAVFIITAQQNSNSLKEGREVLNQGDVGGSVTIAQKSAVTIFIKEKRLAGGDETDDQFIMELQIPKNRITGATFMQKPPLVKYVDEIKSYIPFEIEDVAPYQEWIELDPEMLL